jgi:hypothetical protein
MNQDNLAREFTFERDRRERRVTRSFQPPYLTEEGFVLIDRRENSDRRAARKQPANESNLSGAAASDVDWMRPEKEPVACPIVDIVSWRTSPSE